MKNTVNPQKNLKTLVFFSWLTCWVLFGNASSNFSYMFISLGSEFPTKISWNSNNHKNCR